MIQVNVIHLIFFHPLIILLKVSSINRLYLVKKCVITKVTYKINTIIKKNVNRVMTVSLNEPQPEF